MTSNAPQVASAPLRNDLPQDFDAAVDEFERWCRHLLLAAFQRLGFFTAAGASETKASIMRKVQPLQCSKFAAADHLPICGMRLRLFDVAHLAQVAPSHDRLASEPLAVLTAAGYIIAAEGTYTATAAADSPATVAALRQLPDTTARLESDVVAQLKSNIVLIGACMEALPQILTGMC